jgi:uncharacterized repeat protein (TIGR01451 family)
MNRNLRLGVYLLVLLALFGAGLMGPRAWATSSQARPGQGISVPTPTPKHKWSPEETSTATPTPPAGTPTSISASATPVVAALRLVKAVDRLETWPGATVWFTLTVGNPGAASARQLVLADVLPAELDPGAVQGTSAAWDGRTLRGRLPLLPPGGRWVVTFSAMVREDAGAGKLVVNDAQVSAAGGLNARAKAYLALPPVELPTVGGGADEIRLP